MLRPEDDFFHSKCNKSRNALSSPQPSVYMFLHTLQVVFLFRIVPVFLRVDETWSLFTVCNLNYYVLQCSALVHRKMIRSACSETIHAVFIAECCSIAWLEAFTIKSYIPNVLNCIPSATDQLSGFLKCSQRNLNATATNVFLTCLLTSLKIQIVKVYNLIMRLSITQEIFMHLSVMVQVTPANRCQTSQRLALTARSHIGGRKVS